MISPSINIIKLNEIFGLLQALKHMIFPRHLDIYPNWIGLFTYKIGLEIGGPTRNFSARGLFPVYPVAERVDNINFPGETVWDGILEAEEAFVFDSLNSPGTQYIADERKLDFIETCQYVFEHFSHTIEHLANPLCAH